MEKREKKVTFSQFQKLGKVLMTPVMILPIAGILVGIGSAFTTKNIVALWPVLGNTYVKLFFNLLKAMGNTINSYHFCCFRCHRLCRKGKGHRGIVQRDRFPRHEQCDEYPADQSGHSGPCGDEDRPVHGHGHRFA